MTTLRKKIFHSKIQTIISQNNFVLFFQFNNIKFKDWILLKNQIFNLQSTNVIVIKNKIPYEMILNSQTQKYLSSVVNDCKFSSKVSFNKKFSKHRINLSNQSKHDSSCDSKKNLASHFIGKKNIPYLKANKQQLNFLCQGPTLMIAFNSIQQCKAIYEILNVLTYNFSYSKFQFKPESLDLYRCKTSYFDNTKLPSLFGKKKDKLHLYLQKSNFANQKNIKSNFFFIGGLIQGKAINYLDFEKLLQLNNSVYIDLIQQYSSPIVWFIFFTIILKIKLMKCFQINLINLLSMRKHN